MGGLVSWKHLTAEEMLEQADIDHWLAPLVYADTVPAALRGIEEEKREAQQREDAAEPQADDAVR